MMIVVRSCRCVPVAVEEQGGVDAPAVIRGGCRAWFAEFCSQVLLAQPVPGGQFRDAQDSVFVKSRVPIWDAGEDLFVRRLRSRPLVAVPERGDDQETGE